MTSSVMMHPSNHATALADLQSSYLPLVSVSTMANNRLHPRTPNKVTITLKTSIYYLTPAVSDKATLVPRLFSDEH